jgi:hypothetical protein
MKLLITESMITERVMRMGCEAQHMYHTQGVIDENQLRAMAMKQLQQSQNHYGTKYAAYSSIQEWHNVTSHRLYVMLYQLVHPYVQIVDFTDSLDLLKDTSVYKFSHWSSAHIPAFIKVTQ